MIALTIAKKLCWREFCEYDTSYETNQNNYHIGRYNSVYSFSYIYLDITTSDKAIYHQEASNGKEGFDACLSTDDPELLCLCQRTEVHKDKGESKQIAQKVETVVTMNSFYYFITNKLRFLHVYLMMAILQTVPLEPSRLEINAL